MSDESPNIPPVQPFEDNSVPKAPPKREISALVWGVILLVVGLLFLADTLGVLDSLQSVIWAMLFAAGGAVFLFLFFSDRDRWWAVIPGMALLGISGVIGLDALMPRLGEVIGGSLFLGALGLAFWVVYLNNREFWWAIIPGGVLVTLAAVAAVDQIVPFGDWGGTVFFLGVGLTFLLVYLVPAPQGRMRWAIIPAGICLVLSVIVAAGSTGAAPLVFGAALVAAGLYLLVRATRTAPRE